MRTCSCTGYLSNPGGRCCMDLQTPPPTPHGSTNTYIGGAPFPQSESIEVQLERVLEKVLRKHGLI